VKPGKFFQASDAVALGLTLVAAVLLIQYSLARSGKPALLSQPVVLEVRLPRPIPAVIARVAPGDAILDTRGQSAGRILSFRWVEPMGSYPGGRWSGTQDLLMEVLLEGEIPLVRDEPGFARAPARLKAGAWCLITTAQVELSALIVSIEALLPAATPVRQTGKP
jgi:hypothetical protein